jgi:pyrimidine operon attenuation protein / uracil phosphoribosyltransferase
MTEKIVFESPQVTGALERMAKAMAAPEVWLIGIRRGGSRVADRLQALLAASGSQVHRGDLDISFYRDDLDTIGPNPEVRPSRLPFDLSGRTLWLVDDVLYTGRTIRAALGELFDYGRPAGIRLAVLVDRGGRQLPIAADVTGLSHPAPEGYSVKLRYDGDDWCIVEKSFKP